MPTTPEAPKPAEAAATTPEVQKPEAPKAAVKPTPRNAGVGERSARILAALTKSAADSAKTEPAPTEPKAADKTAEIKAEAKKDEAKKEPVSPKLAELMQRERDLLKREQRLKEVEAKEKTKDAARKAGNYEAILQAEGLSFEKVQDFFLNGKKPTAEIKAEADRSLAESVAAEVAELKKQQQDAAVAQAQAYYRAQALHFAKAQEEKFQAFVAYGDEATELALAVFEKAVKEEGRQIPYDEVIASVDAYLERRAEPLLTTKRFKSKISPVVQPPAVPPATSTSGPSRAAPRTLTNAAVAAAPVEPRGKRRSLAEQRARLEAALRNGGSSGG